MLLNAGFEAKAKIPRCVGQGQNLEVKDFAVFCPKALAGIGRLPDTVRDRSIPIQLVRRSRDEQVQRFRKREAEREAAAIRTALEAWAKTPNVIEQLRAARPTIPEQLSDRQADICEPLLAIADMAGGDWPERTRASLIKLCVQTSADDSLGVKLLADVQLVFDEVKIDRLSTQDLLRGLVDLDTDSPWATWWEDNLKHGNTRGPARRLAHLLKSYRIESRTIRLADNTTAKGYGRGDFLDAWKRYLPPFARLT